MDYTRQLERHILHRVMRYTDDILVPFYCTDCKVGISKYEDNVIEKPKDYKLGDYVKSADATVIGIFNKLSGAKMYAMEHKSGLIFERTDYEMDVKD